ncbi:MAG: phosphoribosylaminoimidazolecarboxamide formyltransferase / cyclohydrolase, partial [Bacteroidota bacterium]|nr:phosphoribosylaminoimidazolecarboxamide formyltransferase / cyclohydrolase [Bacteroidota bacterium]
MFKPEEHRIKTAIISVSDKTGIVEFAKELSDLGIEIFTTGGTFSKLRKNGIDVKSISELTLFPEILDGRVKTLHPAVHAGLLANLSLENHRRQIESLNLKSIDLLIVNLYPFEETLSKSNSTREELIENIDIGGPAMLRSAAKNYLWTAPIVNPARYEEVLRFLKENDLKIDTDYRRILAGEVFAHTAYYDSLIADWLNSENDIQFPDRKTIPTKLDYMLRYGENPHQQAALYGSFSKYFTKLHGKELSYNNILDIDSAARLIVEFDESAFAIIKHTNPCGVGLSDNLIEAYNKAFATDTVSPFGGIFAVNRIMDAETAEHIHSIFSEVIIAPDYTADALDILKKKRDRRLIKVNLDQIRNLLAVDFKSVVGGLLMQSSNKILINNDTMKVVTKRQPTEEETKALFLAWKVAKHVKSNSIVYAGNDRTLGIGAGQMSRVDSSRIAVEKAEQMGLDLKGSCLASDAFFPFADGLMQAVEAGATAVIEPGGSVRDEEVIRAADDNNVAMIFTGIRHF